MIGHPRRGIRLEEIGIALPIHQKIHPSPTTATQNAEGFQRLRPQFQLARFRQAAGAAILGVITQILRFVVLKLGGRLDLDDRQSLHVLAFANDGHRVFAAHYAFCGDHQRIMARRFQIGLTQFARLTHHGNADR